MVGIFISTSLPAFIIPDPVSTNNGEIGLIPIFISSVTFAAPDVSKIILPFPICDDDSIPNTTLPVALASMRNVFLLEVVIDNGPSTFNDTSTFATEFVVLITVTGVTSESLIERNLGTSGSIIRSSATFICSSAEPN